ncbi:MAG TPA: hypothetical protein VIP56_01795 [Nitrososphaeraceae archaeon]
MYKDFNTRLTKLFVLMEITGKNFNGRLCRECGGTEGLKRSVTREYIRKVEGDG